jgi:Ca-activated chloride channel family protein
MKRLVLVAGVLVVALGASVAIKSIINGGDHTPVVVVQWANSHPTREGLLIDMAEKYNEEDHEIDGHPIEVKVVPCDSAVQAQDLVARVKAGSPGEGGCTTDDGAAPDPTIVTPQSRDWLTDVNTAAGRQVVDAAGAPSIAQAWIGIVTYRAMAKCLGWPDKEIGYADIIALRADPRGWAKYPSCAEAEWGRTPKLAFTNPLTSTTGRNVLVSLYASATGKAPADITVADVQDPTVAQSVRDFQQLVDHYMPGTIPLNTKVCQGPQYGQFFLMPEDNLSSLGRGSEQCIGKDGQERPVAPRKDLVMIYPHEGSVLNANPAAVVDAKWVGSDEAEAAGQWIDFIRNDDNQREFVRQGFRPGTGASIPVTEANVRSGLSRSVPSNGLEPGDLSPTALQAILDSWPAVKKPAVVTFVIDTSGSMKGEKLAQVKVGLGKVIDNMKATGNVVGAITFSDTVNEELPPAPIAQNRFDLVEMINRMEASGSTALYDAVQRGIELSDQAPAEDGATRAVVVLSDGEMTTGRLCLDDVVGSRSKQEVPITAFCGAMGDKNGRDANGNTVAKRDIVGESLVTAHDHPVQVFFVGFGDADIDVGRILAQATGAEYRGSTKADLAEVIEETGQYF